MCMNDEKNCSSTLTVNRKQSHSTVDISELHEADSVTNVTVGDMFSSNK